VNITLITHVEFAGTDVAQVFVCENTGLVPEMVTEVIGSDALLELVTVADWGALAVLIVSLPKARVAGVTE
jgi:hypothetical protein